jgi:hypothetical protein
LDLRNNKNLEFLGCNYNQLMNIMFPEEGSQLQYFDCMTNHLTEIDLEKLPKLVHFRCGGNELTELDLSQNVDLEWFRYESNQLSCLDLSQNSKLITVSCSDNNLSYLNVQNGSNDSLMQFWALNNNLSCIQVDNVTFFDTSFAPSMFVDSAMVYSTNCNYQDSCTASSLEEEQHEQERFLLYPNPASHYIYVKEEGEKSIYSLVGSPLLRTKEERINVSHLPAGSYLLELNGEWLRWVKE